MIISLNTREKIIELLDKLVATNKIERLVDANTGMVSFAQKQGCRLRTEFIVTHDGESVLIDDIVDADEDNILIDLMRFAGKNGATIPGDKIAPGASNQVYNEILANILLTIRYNKLKPNGVLKMALPTSGINNEEILIARGFFTSDLKESAKAYRNNMKVNAAVQDLINFYREQKQTMIMQREEMTQNLAATSTIDASVALKLRNQQQQAEQEFKNNVDKQLQSLLGDRQSLQNEKFILDTNFNKLPKSFLRNVHKGTAKTPADAAKKRDAAYKSRTATRVFCDVSTALTMFGIGFILLPIGGVAYLIKDRSCQKAKRELLRSQTYYGYEASEQAIQKRMTEVYQEAANYLALLGPEEAARYLALFGIEELTTTTTNTQSYATTSSALHSSSNPANANAVASPTNLARQLRDAAEGELKVPTKDSPKLQ